MYHQQLQGVPKNKKSSGGASRNKSSQAAHKGVNVKDQVVTTIVKEATPKKEKKIAAVTPAVTRFVRLFYLALRFYHILFHHSKNLLISL